MTKPYKYCRDRVNYWGYTIINENQINNNTQQPATTDNSNNNNNYNLESNNNNINNDNSFLIKTPNEFILGTFKLNINNISLENNLNNRNSYNNSIIYNSTSFSSEDSSSPLSNTDKNIESELDQISNKNTFYSMQQQIHHNSINDEDKKRKKIDDHVAMATNDASKRIKLI